MASIIFGIVKFHSQSPTIGVHPHPTLATPPDLSSALVFGHRGHGPRAQRPRPSTHSRDWSHVRIAANPGHRCLATARATKPRRRWSISVTPTPTSSSSSPPRAFPSSEPLEDATRHQVPAGKDGNGPEGLIAARLTQPDRSVLRNMKM